MFRAPLNRLGLIALAGLIVGCNTKHHLGKLPKDAPAPAQQSAAAPPRALPQGSAEGVPEHLLHEYASREPASEAEIRTWQLPFQAKRIAVALLTLAAKDDPSGMQSLFTRQARWGAPDRRELDARSVFAGDGGREFFDTFREVASRFGRKETFFCPPIVPPSAQTYVRNGAEPMWCAYLSKDGLDILAFKFTYEGGSAKIDYIGLWPNRPTSPVRMRSGAAQPPMTPQIKRGTGPLAPMMGVDQTGGSGLQIAPRDPGAAPAGAAPAGAAPAGAAPTGAAAPAGDAGAAPAGAAPAQPAPAAGEPAAAPTP